MAMAGDDNDPTSMDRAIAVPPVDDAVKLDERIQGLLGERLSTYYGALVAEPVPAKFLELLSRLDKAESSE